MHLIRELRKAKGLSQRELAALLEVHQTAVSQWENGRTDPDINLLPALADILEVTVDYLLGHEETKKGPPEREPTTQPDKNELRNALSGELKDLTDEEYEEILNYIRFVEQKRRKK